MHDSDQNHWRRVAAIFEKALEVDVASRMSFLESTCPDPTLRQEVERLLAAHQEAGDFLGTLDPFKSAALLNTETSADLLPERIGRYDVEQILGSGAMGIVYLAHDPQLQRNVAIKVLRVRHSISQSGQRRLLGEARSASALDHPNVAAVYEIGETNDGQTFIAMAFCEGESLATRIARSPLDVHEAAAIAQQLASALAAAHALGIVHRDVKPANIALSRDGRARLMDFGVASVVGEAGFVMGMNAGTPAYMSPEQVVSEAVSPATDVWALGIVLYEMLTGRRPFRDETREALRSSILTQTPGAVRYERSDVPVGLAHVVERCLAKHAADRPTAEQLVAELQLYATKSARRTRTRAVTSVAVVATMIVGGVFASNRYASKNDAGAVAIMPFTAVDNDLTLERLGRELVVTLGTSLHGVPNVRVVEAISVLGDGNRSHATLESRLQVASKLGAATIIDGRLTRVGEQLRADAVVYAVKDKSVIARASAISRNDIIALTDSLALALLRTSWRGRSETAPNLAALTTNSVAAMRAYLEGELHVAAGRFRSAPQAFAQAFQADSTFWFAYWRYWYAQSYHGNPVDSSVIAKVIGHRNEFPEADRLLVEARLSNGNDNRVELLRSIAVRHPTYWPALFELGDMLTHNGPFLGIPAEEARLALRRTTELNPNFVPAWEHLFWLDLLAADAVESAKVLARLEAMRLDTLLTDEWGLQPLDYYRYLNDLNRSGGKPQPAMTALGGRLLAGFGGPIDPERNAATLTNYGFHRAQLDLSRAVLAHKPPAAIAAAHMWGSALASAGRGAWYSALSSARDYARVTPHPNGPLWAFGLGAAGAWLGQLEGDSLAGLRELAVRSAAGRSVDGIAEIAWLDGLLACRRGDEAGLQRSEATLRVSPTPAARTLAASLNAFGATFNQKGARAANSLALLEHQNGDTGWAFRYGPRHPFLMAINRIAGARLLLTAGDTTEAIKLLRLHEIDLPQRLHPMPTVSFIIGTQALGALADIETARNHTAEASRYRALLRSRVDLAPNMNLLTNQKVCGSRPGTS